MKQSQITSPYYATFRLSEVYCLLFVSDSPQEIIAHVAEIVRLHTTHSKISIVSENARFHRFLGENLINDFLDGALSSRAAGLSAPLLLKYLLYTTMKAYLSGEKEGDFFTPGREQTLLDEMETHMSGTLASSSPGGYLLLSEAELLLDTETRVALHALVAANTTEEFQESLDHLSAAITEQQDILQMVETLDILHFTLQENLIEQMYLHSQKHEPPSEGTMMRIWLFQQMREHVWEPMREATTTWGESRLGAGCAFH